MDRMAVAAESEVHDGGRRVLVGHGDVIECRHEVANALNGCHDSLRAGEEHVLEHGQALLPAELLGLGELLRAIARALWPCGEPERHALDGAEAREGGVDARLVLGPVPLQKHAATHPEAKANAGDEEDEVLCEELDGTGHALPAGERQHDAPVEHPLVVADYHCALAHGQLLAPKVCVELCVVLTEVGDGEEVLLHEEVHRNLRCPRAKRPPAEEEHSQLAESCDGRAHEDVGREERRSQVVHEPARRRVDGI
mmetsp:Transcript_3939/g.13951  ORF Transcript_3939/g.13951 Transcript_3939/m.13951 type:complete len:254 (+) Transcript_3939:248-1009(+)